MVATMGTTFIVKCALVFQFVICLVDEAVRSLCDVRR